PSVQSLTELLAEEAASSPTLDQRLNQLELDFLNSPAQERTVRHPSVTQFIFDSRHEEFWYDGTNGGWKSGPRPWLEIAKDIEAVFCLTLSDTTVRRAAARALLS